MVRNLLRFRREDDGPELGIIQTARAAMLGEASLHDQASSQDYRHAHVNNIVNRLALSVGKSISHIYIYIYMYIRKGFALCRRHPL